MKKSKTAAIRNTDRLFGLETYNAEATYLTWDEIRVYAWYKGENEYFTAPRPGVGYVRVSKGSGAFRKMISYGYHPLCDMPKSWYTIPV